MGQTLSGCSPLTLITDHFKEVRARAHNLSVEIKKSRMVIFCSAEWPSFNVGWPPEGTFDLKDCLESLRNHPQTSKQTSRPGPIYPGLGSSNSQPNPLDPTGSSGHGDLTG